MTSHHFAKKKTDDHIAALQDYLDKRKKEGLGVPQSSARKGHVANAFISSETGIPVHVLEKARVHKVVLGYVREIGFSEQLPNKWVISSASQPLYTRLVKNYLTRLKNDGRKVPEQPEKLGQPHLEHIASECGIPLRALRPRTSARSVLDKGILELGLQMYADEPVWMELTYGQLLEDGARLRAQQLEGRRGQDQQRYNTTSMLRLWMRSLSLSSESLVGEEMLGQFGRKLGQALLSVKTKTTKSKFASEMRRWVGLHAELLKQKGLPANFTAALEMAIERSGLNAQRVTELARGRQGVISGWLRGEALPSKSSFPFITRIESALKLEPGALTSLIPHGRSMRFRLSDYPEYASADGVKIPMRSNSRLLGQLCPLLPDDFNMRPEAARQEMVNWLVVNLIGPTSDWGLLNRELGRTAYALKEFPPILEHEWQELSEFKCGAFTPPGMSRRAQWSAATATMRRRDLERIFGALALPENEGEHRLSGLGLDPRSFTLAMFICPAVLHWWITWKGKRRCGPQPRLEDYKYTHYEASLLFIIGGLFDKKTGWIQQRSDLAGHLQVVPGFIDKQLIRCAKSDWTGMCEQAFEHYMKFAEELQGKAELIRDPFEPILPILESESPISALRIFAQNVLDDVPDAVTRPLQAARAIRDYLIVRLLGATALRSKNIIELTYRSDNKGELHKEKGKWVVEIPHWRFKNKNSPFFGPRKKKHSYKKMLADVDGLYDRIEEYINIHRQIILHGGNTDIFFVVGPARPKFTKHKFHRKYRLLTTRYLAHNPYLGRGIPGVKPHGPHAVRDIVATHIIKITGSYELAAYALGDSVMTVKEHYARFMPEHKLHLADRVMVEAWQ